MLCRLADGLDAPVLLPPAGEYAADGAARRAVWVLGGHPEPPEWSAAVAAQPIRGSPAPHMREDYAKARDHSE
jgi:xylulokinase